MHKGLLMIGSLMGAFAVALGAFGAHALKQRLSIEDIAVYQTGVQYHFYHVMAIFIAAFLWNKFYPNMMIIWSGRLFLSGIFLFSGSLYLITYLKVLGGEKTYKWLAILTPMGGVCFIIGWLLLGWGMSKRVLKSDQVK